MEVAGQAALAFLRKTWQGPGELQCPWRRQSEIPPKMGASRRSLGTEGRECAQARPCRQLDFVVIMAKCTQHEPHTAAIPAVCPGTWSPSQTEPLSPLNNVSPPPAAGAPRSVPMTLTPQVPHTSGAPPDVSFCVGHVSPGAASSSSVHIAAGGGSPSFLRPSNIPRRGRTTSCLPTHLSVDAWAASVLRPS